MKNNYKITFLKYIICILFFAFSCGNKSSKENSNQKENKKATEQNLTIDTFSTIPHEIDGCSCCFSNNEKELEKGLYIYVNNFVETAFLKINGNMIKFTQTEHKKIDDKNIIAKYKNQDFEITINIKEGKENGYESKIQTGTITITDKNGNKIEKKFYGECAC